MEMKGKLLHKGFHVSEPVLATCYDFITEYDGIIHTVQLRTASFCNDKGYYRIRARGRYGIGGYSVLLAHIPVEETTYVLPWNSFKTDYIIIHKDRPNKHERFKENWQVLKEAH